MEEINEAKQLLAKPQSIIQIDNAMVGIALKSLARLKESHLELPEYWEVLANAQLLSGQLSAAKDSLQTVADMKGEAASSRRTGPGKSRERKPVRSFVSSAGETQDGFAAPYTLASMFHVQDALFQLVRRGMGDLRVRFFLAMICKVQKDFDGCIKWLGCDGLGDDFLQRYILLYGKLDYYNYHWHAWLPKGIFELLAATPIGQTRGDMELQLHFFTMWLSQAAEVEKEQVAILEQKALLYDPDDEIDDEEAEAEEREEMMLSENDKDAQLWRFCRGCLLREDAKLDLALFDFGAVIDSNENESVTQAAHLHKAHIFYETGEIFQAMELYDKVQNDAKALKQSTMVTEEDPSVMHPHNVHADALAGMARIQNLQGQHERVEELILKATQADDCCGDAVLLTAIRLLLHGDLQTARNIFARLHQDSEDREERSRTVTPYLVTKKWIRMTKWSLDNLLGMAAQRRAQVKEVGAKDEIVEHLDSGHITAENGEETWQFLLCFVAEGQWRDCVELLEMMIISFGDDVWTPPAMSAHALSAKADAAARRLSVADLDGQHEEEDPSEALRSKVSKLIARAAWLSDSAGWSLQSLGDLSVALQLLGSHGGSRSTVASREPSSSSVGLNRAPSSASSRSKELEDLRRKALWKRHKIFLGRGNADRALSDLEGCVAVLDAELARERALQMLGRSLGQGLGKVTRRLAKCWYSRGVIKYKQFKHEEAEKCFLEAKAEDATAAAAKGYLGLIYSYRGPGHRSLAIQMLRQSLEDLGHIMDERIVRMKLAALLSQSDTNAHQYQAALDEYTLILSRNPEDSEALAMRGGVYMLDGNWEAAVHDYTASLDAHASAALSKDRMDQVYYWRGRAFQHLGLYHEALKDYDNVRGPTARSLELLQNMAFAHEAVGNIRKALVAYDAILQVIPVSDAGYLNVLQHRAALSSVCNKIDQALQDLNQIVQMAPSDMQARYQRGCTLCTKYSSMTLSRTVSTDFDAAAQLLRTAIQDFNAVLRENPHHTKASLRRRAAYNSLREQPPEDEDLEQGMQAIESGELKGVEAGLIVDYALRMASDVHEEQVSQGKGERFHALMKLTGSISAASDLKEWEDEHVVVDREGRFSFANKSGIREKIGFLGQCSAVRCDFGNGLFAFRMTFTQPKKRTLIFGAKLLSDREDVFRSVFRFANASSPDLPYSKPIYLLEIAYRRNPEDMVPLFYIGRLCEQQKQYSMAKSTYMRVLSCLNQEPQAPSRPGVHAEKSDAHVGHHGHGELDDADRLQGITEGMIQLWPGNSQANVLKSDIFYRLGMMRVQSQSETSSFTAKQECFQGAIRFLRYSVNIDASHKLANFHLGVLQLRANHQEEAVASFLAVVRIDPQFAEAYNNLGVAYSLSSQHSEALAAFEEAERLSPDMQQAICNMCLTRLHIGMLAQQPGPGASLRDLSWISDLIPTMSRAVAVPGPSTALAHSVRGLCYHLRNHNFIRSTSDSHHFHAHSPTDLDLAKEDYLSALALDESYLMARAALVLLFLQKKDLGSAAKHLDLLREKFPSNDLVGELRIMAGKVEMAYVEAIGDMEFALRMNPCFSGLSLSAPNVDLPTLCCRQTLVDLVAAEMRDRSFLSRSNSSSRSARSILRSKSPSSPARRLPGEQCIALAMVALEQGNYQQAQAQFTNVMSLLPPSSDAMAHALIWRAQAMHLGGNCQLAIEDAEKALMILAEVSLGVDSERTSGGPSFAIDSVEHSRSQFGSIAESARGSVVSPLGATLSRMGSRRGSALSLISGAGGEVELGPALKKLHHQNSMTSRASVSGSRKSSMILEEQTSSDTVERRLVYALLCYLGALKQVPVINDEEGARKCYRAAKQELPSRLEAHINIGNLEKRARKPESCMNAYLGALKAMLTIEEATNDSVFRELQEKVYHLMQSYRKEWKLANETGSYDQITTEKKQGELLLLNEQFELVLAERTGQSAVHRRAARKRHPFNAARENLMKEGTECVELIGKGHKVYSKDPEQAFAVYNRFNAAVDNVFYSLAAEFPGEAATQDKELREFIRFSDLQGREESAKEDPQGSMATIHFASKLLHLARPGHAKEIKLDSLSLAIKRVKASLVADDVPSPKSPKEQRLKRLK